MKLLKKYKWPLAIFGILAVLVVFRLANKKADGNLISEPIQKGKIIESVYGIGTVSATRSFQLKSGITTSVRKLYVKEGDNVHRGDKLVDLDDVGGFSAPFDGTITFLPAKVGETVFAQSNVLHLTDLSDRYITVSLEQRGALRVRHQQKARISFDSLRDKVFDGIVESIYSNDGNFLVRIRVTSLPPEILPGMTADVSIGIREKQDVVLIPVAAIQKNQVTVSRDGRQGPTVDIKIGIIDGAKAELLSGSLQEGDRLVIKKQVTP